MIINSMIIKLKRLGGNNYPSYILTIHGNGKFTYEGKENVNTKGIVEEKISEEKILDLLTILKKYSFFSQNKNFEPINDLQRPHTSISVTIPKEDRSAISKKIMHYNEDNSVPIEINKIEGEIEGIVGSDRWVKIKKEPVQPIKTQKPIKAIKAETKQKIIKSKPIKTTKKRLPLKMIAGIFCILIVLIFLIYAISSGIIDLSGSSPNNGNNKNGSVKTDPIDLTYITPVDFVNEDTWEYHINYHFIQGHTVYIYQEFTNISTNNDGNCDLFLELTIHEFVPTELEKNLTITKIIRGEVVNKYIWEISTDESWPLGDYTFTSTINDLISNNSSKINSIFIIG